MESEFRLGSHLHSVAPVVLANATYVARIRILLLQLFTDLVRLVVDVTLVLGPFFQVIAVVLYRATVTLLFVLRLAAQQLVMHQRAGALGLVAYFLVSGKEREREIYRAIRRIKKIIAANTVDTRRLTVTELFALPHDKETISKCRDD